MGLKYVKEDEFEKGKEDNWPKHKAKAVKDDEKEDNDDWRRGGHGNNNEQYDGEWIEVVKGSTTKIIKAAASLPNNNTFILLADDRGPRKKKHNKIRYSNTHQTNVYHIREITQQNGKTGLQIETTHAP